MLCEALGVHRPEKINIQIDLIDGTSTYRTGQKLQGVAYITTKTDLDFDGIHIEFLGTSRTAVEHFSRVAPITNRSTTCHQFLKLQQHGLQQYYPEAKVLKRGQRIACPFEFIIPRQLLSSACQHSVCTPLLRNAHLQLPPSLGRERNLNSTSKRFGDSSLDLASIVYGVSVGVSRGGDGRNASSNKTIANKFHPVCITPAGEEQPPLDVDGQGTGYIMHRNAAIKQSWYGSALCSFKVEATQPPPLTEKTEAPTRTSYGTFATVNLRFSSANVTDQPPQLRDMRAILEVSTTVAAVPSKNFPNGQSSPFDIGQRVHSEQLSLPSGRMNSVQWTKDDRCDEEIDHKSHYIAILQVPIMLPPGTHLAPTFHSCFVSRTYKLKLKIRVRGWQVIGRTDLELPLQLLHEGPLDIETIQYRTIDESTTSDGDKGTGPFMSVSEISPSISLSHGINSSGHRDLGHILPDYDISATPPKG